MWQWIFRGKGKARAGDAAPAGPAAVSEMDPDRRHLAHLERMAEEAYDRLYEVHTQSDATAAYSDAKEALYDAIGLARRLGLDAEAERLSNRLAHIKAVFRSQFS